MNRKPDESIVLLGVKADGTEHVLGTVTMPPTMKAREIVRKMVGEPDEEVGNDAAQALWCCEQLIDWMGVNPPVISVTPPAVTRLREAIEFALAGNGEPANWRFVKDRLQRALEL